MRLRCTNNDEMDGILTKGRVYAGEMAYHRDFIKIYRCDDKLPGFFEFYRFEEVVTDVDPILWGDPEVKINHYFVEVEKH